MERKGLDMIVANDVSDRSIGFNSDANAVTVFWPGGEQAIALTTKDNLASSLIQLISQQLDVS
jgi:phosphopantothenoylcysteine decarboxylase/phosphopantothenate--cysteine ligase